MNDMKKTAFGNVTAIVLAGGKSSRMGGADKSMLEVNGIPMIQFIVNQLEGYFDEIIIGANDIEKYRFLGLRVIPDIEQGKGPLMGIYSCLLESGNDLNFITACDIPVMDTGLILKMLNIARDADIVVPVKGENEYEPLYGIYRKSVIHEAEVVLGEGKRKIADLFSRCNTRFIDFNSGDWYHNLNFRDDYLRYTGKIG